MFPSTYVVTISGPSYLKVKESAVSSVDDIDRRVRPCDIDNVHLKVEKYKYALTVERLY